MPNRPPYMITRPRVASIDSTRPCAAKRGYGSAWQRTRTLKLAATPMCEDCNANGLTTAATEVDHVKSLAAGGTHDLENLRSLCKPCHSRKTVKCDGGLGRR